MTDPLRADPADIAVAITLPSGLAPVPNSAVLNLATTGSAANIQAKIILAQTSMENNRYLYAVKPQDLARLREAQRQILAQKALGESHGQLNVNFAVCKLGDGPADDARGSIDVRLDADGPLMPLFDNAKLDRIIAPDALRQAIPCKGAK